MTYLLLLFVVCYIISLNSTQEMLEVLISDGFTDDARETPDVFCQTATRGQHCHSSQTVRLFSAHNTHSVKLKNGSDKDNGV